MVVKNNYPYIKKLDVCFEDKDLKNKLAIKGVLMRLLEKTI